jgi:quercetin dioxygenase-like cupin family protein
MNVGHEVLDADGYGLIFRHTAGTTNGQLMEMDAFYKPHSQPPPSHYHPRQTEHFQVMSGRFRVVIDGQATSYGAGDSFEVPAGVIHAMHNESGEKGHLIWQTRPALRSEEFFAALWTLELLSPAGGRGLKQLLRLAVLFDEYRAEVRLSGGPAAILRLLAPIGRLLRVKPTISG